MLMVSGSQQFDSGITLEVYLYLPTPIDIHPQRQHWDIAVLGSPPETIIEGQGAYDYLRLDAVVEFGMNEGKEHLVDDIERLSHTKANLKQGFAVHLYRISKPGFRLSGRDWSPKSKQILTPENIR